MSGVSENEFNKIFLKNFFKEAILAKKGPHPVDVLDDMGGILADIFLKEFGSENTPSKILAEHEDIEEWLYDKIENF